MMKNIGIITINFFSEKLIHEMEALLIRDPNANFYVVDNSLSFQPMDSGTVVIKPKGNIGFGNGCNLGASSSNEDILIFINPDCKFDLEVLKNIKNIIIDDPACIAGPTINYGDGTTSFLRKSDRSLIKYKRFSIKIGESEVVESIYISGAFLAISRSLYESLNGFNPNIFMYGEDLELCLRASSMGSKIIVDRKSIVSHKGGKSSSKIYSKFLRLFRSFRGHYTAISGKHTFASSVLTAAYLASGRKFRV